MFSDKLEQAKVGRKYLHKSTENTCEMAEMFNFPHNTEILGVFDVFVCLPASKNSKTSLNTPLGPICTEFVQASLFKFLDDSCSFEIKHSRDFL